MCSSLACSVSSDSAASLDLACTRRLAIIVALPFPPLFLWRGVLLPFSYHASDADTDEPLSAQESHGHDVLFPSLFDELHTHVYANVYYTHDFMTGRQHVKIN